MALTDLTRISTSGIATGTSLSGAILHGDAHFRGTQVGVTSALFDSSDNALEFNDNVKLKFGNSGDLQLYHNASNSMIEDHGTGNLEIRTVNGTKVTLQGGGNPMVNALKDAQVELYFNNSKKIETTNHGAVVTGILTATSFSGPLSNASGISTFYDLRVSNNLTVEGTTTTLDTNVTGVDRLEINANSNTTTAIVGIQSGSADILNLSNASGEQVTILSNGNVGIGSAVPELDLDVTRVSSGDNVVKVQNRGSALSLIKYPNVNNSDVRAGSDYGNFAVYTGGDSGSRKLKVEHGGDVKVENGFFAVTDPGEKIGIGLATPTKPLHIYTAGVDSEIRFQTNSGTEQNSYISLRHATGHLDFYTVQSGTNMKFHIANNERLKLEDSGLTVTGQVQLTSGNQIKLLNNANSASSTIDCDGGARLHLKSYNQSVATFEEGAGTIFYQSNGTNRLQITPTGGIEVGAGGTIKIPDKIMHSGDEDSSIRFPAHGQFSFETNGYERFKFTETDATLLNYSGNHKVGIGTDVLVAKLDIKNHANIPVLKLNDSHFNKYLTIIGGGSPNRMIIDAYEGGGGGAAIDLASNGDTKVRINSSGDVGIGTDPARRLSIFDTDATVLELNSTNSGGTSLRIQNNHTDKMFMGLAGDFIVGQASNVTDSAIRASGDLLFATGGGNEKVRITSGGTVGINDTTPNTYFKLDVNGHTNIVGDIALPTTNRIYFGNSDTAFIKGEHGGSGYLAFGANNEKMRLTRAGKLGIGMNSDQIAALKGKLDIDASGIDAAGDTDDPNDYAIVIRNPSTTNQGNGIAFTNDSGANVGGAIIHIDKGTNNIGDLVFYTSAASNTPIEKLRITSAGVVDVTGSIIVDAPTGGATGLSINGIAGETCGVIRQRNDNHHAIILRGSSNADGSTITGGNTMEFREYGHFVFKTGTGSMAERIRITNSEMKFTANQTFNADNTYWIGTNGIKPARVYGHKFVHREGTSNGVGINEQEAIWYGGNINVFHDNATLSTSNFTWGLTGSRGYALLRIRNNAGSPQAIYAEAGSITSGSDYRMKENIVEITNGIETVKKLKPSIYNIRKTFNPNDDGKKHHGFVAHEVQEAIPDIGNIVSGTKDAMEEVFYKDEDENIPAGKKPGDSTGTFSDKPDYQGIDYGHMTPVLAAAIKELITKVETLEAEVAALKSS